MRWEWVKAFLSEGCYGASLLISQKIEGEGIWGTEGIIHVSGCWKPKDQDSQL